jgi:hypothetical protein
VPPLQQGRDIVDAGHLTPAAGRRERRVPAPRGDVKHLLAGTHIDGFTQELTHEHQGVADRRIIASSPYLLLALLDDGEIGHVHLPPLLVLADASTMMLQLVFQPPRAAYHVFIFLRWVGFTPHESKCRGEL